MGEQVEKGTAHWVKKIEQVDNHTFLILWGDGEEMTYRLSEVQKCCPCAHCSEGGAVVQEDVRAHRIRSVGRYALRVDFTSGCSNGIYPFSTLYNLDRTEAIR